MSEQPVVTKDTLAKLLSLAKVVPSHAAGKKAFDVLIHGMRCAFRTGVSVKLNGFGVFSVVETPARTGRNPKTDEEFEIPAGRKVKFKPSKKLLEG